MSLSHHVGLGAIVVDRQHLRVVPQDRAGARQEDRRHQVGCRPKDEQGIQLIRACGTDFFYVMNRSENAILL